ncbi:MAG: hypothetical protein KAQ96_01715, partial [Thermoplasmata archaeon]|nr:hypothetical protein [Thermoplasmata archaeon]
MEIEHSELNAVTFGGIVVTVNITVPADGDEVTLRGSLPDDLESNVTDMALLDNETVLLTTMNGTWVMGSGEAMPFSSSDLSMPRSNDIRSVSHQANTLWTLTPEGISFLEFDSLGRPYSWSEGPDLGDGATLDTLDTEYQEGRVYICGYGPGIHTYDAFASSAPSRWGRAHVYGDGRDQVLDVLSVEGTLYTGGAYGLDRMVQGSDPPTFEIVPGSPSGVRCLYLIEASLIYLGTEHGLWSYNAANGSWNSPNDIIFGLLDGPVSDISFGGHTLDFAINDTLYGALFADHMEGKVFIKDSDIVRLSSRRGVGDPAWVAVGGRAFTSIDVDLPHGEPEREGLGDAWINDLDIAPDGIVYLTTDSGLHRI